MARPLVNRVMGGVFAPINRKRQWYEFPLPVQLLNLVSLRNDLRDLNLYDNPGQRSNGGGGGEPPAEAERSRQPDGRWTNLEDPDMGSAGTEFTRNIDPARIQPEKPPRLFEPSPREVSLALMTRHEFKPAPTLNVLAAAWIQFENHNWFFHGRGDPDDTMEVPVADDDDWHEHPMRVRRTVPFPGRETSGDGTTHQNTETHWWDGSQLYGSTLEKQRKVRASRDGKLKLADDGRLFPDDVDEGIDLTGFNENWWAGLSSLHVLFTKEHNAICDRLRAEHPDWDDQRLFEVAWLVNSALMAKIHTVEWTPGILGHPALQIAMNANWWGLLGERIKTSLGRFGSGELFSGIVGAETELHDASFQLTEEFVSVYRMHPLIPDDWSFYSLVSGELLQEREFTEIQGANTRAFMDEVETPDILYSLGVANPGAVVLHNFPRALQDFTRIDGERMDLATLDILRDRERGVPRYNDFREELRMPRVKSFEELTANRVWAEEIRRVYRGDIDKVDLQIGMYAETPPPGFGFSDTAFRIFILMASRRLTADRFFTADFRPEVYTQTGIDWVNETTMTDVLLRHYPELGPSLEGVANPFAPWNRIEPKTAGDRGAPQRSAAVVG